ncbi:MAG: RNB domain-containing ribonuclease, partial [Firmicutes bacterium]|nr:RNB domain-containing ribonuclease [Bacillota bacterium]
HSRTLADIIAQIEDQPYEGIVNRVMLRTMKKAYYSTECDGHFGLAFRYYCHFTSPIRRYPDLIIHRIIKESITGRMTEQKLEKYRADAVNAAEISSQTERQAQELERDVEKMKKAEFMLSFIGEEFEGIVSGVTDFGVYVELPNTIEGMSFARDLRRPYQMGEKVRIRVMDARPWERQIDFMIIED